MTYGIDRAPRDLLGTSDFRIGTGTTANPGNKYSNPLIRYLMSFNIFVCFIETNIILANLLELTSNIYYFLFNVLLFIFSFSLLVNKYITQYV